MTAVNLLAVLTDLSCAATVEGEDLVVEGDPPADLEPIVDLLQAPIRAIVTGRKLYAIDAAGRGLGRHGVIDPRELLPAEVRMLCVESLGDWDRISTFAKQAFPNLFAKTPKGRCP